MSPSKALMAIAVGDLIYGIREGGRPDLLLVYSADSANFLARNVFHQATYSFGRDGEGRRPEDGVTCTIVSTAKLPPDLYEVAVGLDRRLGSRPEYPDSRLTEKEIWLALDHGTFFEQHLLPGAEGRVKWAQKLRGVEGLLMQDWDPVHAAISPPSPYQYDENLPALVDLLDRAPSERELARFLASIADQHGRSLIVSARTDAVAAGLLRLSSTWN